MALRHLQGGDLFQWCIALHFAVQRPVEHGCIDLIFRGAVAEGDCAIVYNWAGGKRHGIQKTWQDGLKGFAPVHGDDAIRLVGG